VPSVSTNAGANDAANDATDAHTRQKPDGGRVVSELIRLALPDEGSDARPDEKPEACT
jgi:hypothetical protein